MPTDKYAPCPCDNDIDRDDELKRSLEVLQSNDAVTANLIDVALLNNPATQITWANARAAAFSVEMAKSALYPNVGLDGVLTYSNGWLDEGPPDLLPLPVDPAYPTTCKPQKPNLKVLQRALLDPAQEVINLDPSTGTSISTDAGIGETVSLTTDLYVSYLLLDFGGRDASINAARQALYNSNWVHNRQIQEVIVSVLDAYYTYLGLSALLEARESDLKNAKTNLEAAQELFNAGVRNKLDVLQAETDLINIELNIVDIEGRRQIAFGQLANVLGLPSNVSFFVPPLPQNLPIDVILTGVDQLIGQAMRWRPDLAAAFALHQQRKEEVVIARSAGLPTLQAFIDMQENINISNSSLNNHSISASLVVSTPLFDGFLYTNRVRRAKEFVRGTCANIRQVELNITLDVITSYFNFQAAVESLKLSEKFLKSSEESYEAALAIYREGIGTILDLLTSQRALANAKAQKIQSRTQWAMALSNLSFAIGTLGTPYEIKPKK
jgi:outer membrane protein TolC